MSKTTSALIALGVVAGLGAAALPLSSYAIDPKEAQVGVTLTIEGTLEISANKSTTEKVDLSADGHTGTVDVTVISNNSKGYNLGLAGTAGTGERSNLTSTTNANDVFTPVAGATFAAPKALSTTVSEWGYSVANTNENNKIDLSAFTGSVYAPVADGGETIVNVDKATANAGDKTTVTFAASVADGQPAGEYNGEVTFTATNNPIVAE